MARTSPGRAEQWATRAAFFVAGAGMAAWAPLVPYARERLALDEGALGLLLLFLGAGSLITMPVTGAAVGRLGCRLPILLAGATLAASLPLLALAGSPPLLAAALFLFGASLGMIDVAMNVQAILVDRASSRSIMSGIHGLFSVGGIVGAGGVSALLWLGASPAAAALATAALLVLCLAAAGPRLLPYGDEGLGKTPLFVVPHGEILLIGFLTFIMFLVEGAMLDWSAVFLTAVRGWDPAGAGMGYAAFAVAMAVGRLSGDRLVERVGRRITVLLGSLSVTTGLLTAVALPIPGTTLLGFVLVGLGASNIVPILFTAAGRQTRMPPSLAVASMTTMGYAGVLAGPALIGFVAEATSLSTSLAMVAALVLLVAASARRVTR